VAEGVNREEQAPEPGSAIEPVTPPPTTEVVVAEHPGELVEYVEPAPALEPKVGRRFSFAYAVVAGIFALGALGTVLVLAGFRPGVPPEWSAFRPAGDGVERAQSIADYVAPRYRLQDGNQLVVVSARDAGVGGQQIQFLAVPTNDRYDVIDGAATIAYEMCGLGERCSIRTGEPSADRDRLLRREALEIALYTFKYVSGTDAVVFFMPPPPGQDPTWALLFKRDEFASQLGRPIQRTLSEPVPDAAGLAASAERDMVEQLTEATRYSYEVRDVNGAPVLVLNVPQA
jgi:hypothetical protein